jgi:hypothetical protein
MDRLHDRVRRRREASAWCCPLSADLCSRCVSSDFTPRRRCAFPVASRRPWLCLLVRPGGEGAVQSGHPLEIGSKIDDGTDNGICFLDTQRRTSRLSRSGAAFGEDGRPEMTLGQREITFCGRSCGHIPASRKSAQMLRSLRNRSPSFRHPLRHSCT